MVVVVRILACMRHSEATMAGALGFEFFFTLMYAFNFACEVLNMFDDNIQTNNSLDLIKCSRMHCLISSKAYNVSKLRLSANWRVLFAKCMP